MVLKMAVDDLKSRFQNKKESFRSYYINLKLNRTKLISLFFMVKLFIIFANIFNLNVILLYNIKQKITPNSG